LERGGEGDILCFGVLVVIVERVEKVRLRIDKGVLGRSRA
jgi:hypothetical protein